jgi:acyl carrier protein
MTHDEIQQIVLDGLRLGNEARPDDAQVPLAAETELFGPNGYLDSMALVGLLLDVEDALLEHGVHVALSDERAMSESRSPFRSVETLTDYIERQLAEG